MDESAIKLITAFISLVKALVWPVVLIWVLHRFGAQISALLARLGSLKVAGSEWVFQQPSPKAEEEPVVTLRSTELQVGPDGFLTGESRRAIVLQSTLHEPGETVVGELLIFQTPAQRTWLVATNRKVFVLLDDEVTRNTKRIIQTAFDRARTLPLKFDTEKGAEAVKFAAEETWWYYSKHLFPTPKSLTAAVKRLIQGGT
jgi:hypothetical protein